MNEREIELYIEQEMDKQEYVQDLKHDASLEKDSIFQRKWENLGGRDDQRDQTGR